MDFCSSSVFLEGNKEINKKQGNCYLSTCLRNRGMYSVSITVRGIGRYIFLIIVIFFYLAVSGETVFLFHRA